jgi:thioredoxin reductase (NADPH)
VNMNADIVVIGSGPAGLQAAIHASRKKKNVILIGKISGSALFDAHVENYFGFDAPVTGKTMLENGVSQVKSSGVTLISMNVVSTVPSDEGFSVRLESDETITTKSVILATGISREKLGVPGEKEFLGKGVSYCASCDCNFYKGVPVMIVGNESEAAVSAELMTKYASEVYWSASDPEIDSSLMEKVKASGVKIVNAYPSKISGTDRVSEVLMTDGTSVNVTGVFIELGGRSSVDLAMDLGIMPEMDDTIKVDGKCMTEVAGVFACGDITGKPWQIAKAVGEGSVAGIYASDYVSGLK